MAEETKTEPKPGVQSTEFWLTIMGNAVVMLQGLQGQLDAKWVALAFVVLNGIYTTMRSLVKANSGS